MMRTCDGCFVTQNENVMTEFVDEDGVSEFLCDICAEEEEAEYIDLAGLE